jgi:hypothetical protein
MARGTQKQDGPDRHARTFEEIPVSRAVALPLALAQAVEATRPISRVSLWESLYEKLEDGTDILIGDLTAADFCL